MWPGCSGHWRPLSAGSFQLISPRVPVPPASSDSRHVLDMTCKKKLVTWHVWAGQACFRHLLWGVTAKFEVRYQSKTGRQETTSQSILKTVQIEASADRFKTVQIGGRVVSVPRDLPQFLLQQRWEGYAHGALALALDRGSTRGALLRAREALMAAFAADSAAGGTVHRLRCPRILTCDAARAILSGPAMLSCDVARAILSGPARRCFRAIFGWRPTILSLL